MKNPSQKNKFSIFSDKLNHASINYGNSITKQKLYRYNHLDLNHLEFLIKKSQINTEKIIISESGITNSADLERMTECGAEGFLIGETLMRQNNIEKATKILALKNNVS